jgi:hypothetical protein
MPPRCILSLIYYVYGIKKEVNHMFDTRMDGTVKTSQISERNIQPFKKLKASICKHCPACNHARENPKSIVGRILHHPFHSNHCPIWKAYEEMYGETTASNSRIEEE